MYVSLSLSLSLSLSIYIYKYVCVYICIYIYICIHMYIYVFIYIYTYTYIHIYIHTLVCIYNSPIFCSLPKKVCGKTNSQAGRWCSEFQKVFSLLLKDHGKMPPRVQFRIINLQEYVTGWRRLIGSLIFIGNFPHK